MIAKTAAGGGPSLHPEVLAFSSSLEQDRAPAARGPAREPGPPRHARPQRIVPLGRGPRRCTARWWQLWQEAAAGTWRPAAARRTSTWRWRRAHPPPRRGGRAPAHRAVAERPGGARPHDFTCASRWRRRSRRWPAWSRRWPRGPEADASVLLPGYTHRQRAQPISAGYWWCASGAMFARDLEALGFVPPARWTPPHWAWAPSPARRFPPTATSLAACWASRASRSTAWTPWATATSRSTSPTPSRAACLHAGRLATDVIDFASSEFRFLKLSDAIACGSSLMPQKRNPDVFELVRGKSGPAVGHLRRLAHHGEGAAARLQPRPPGGPRACCWARGRSCWACCARCASPCPTSPFDRTTTVRALGGGLHPGHRRGRGAGSLRRRPSGRPTSWWGRWWRSAQTRGQPLGAVLRRRGARRRPASRAALAKIRGTWTPPSAAGRAPAGPAHPP